MPWALIAKFIWEIASGEAFSIWKAHKANEAIAAQNNASAMGGTDAQKDADTLRR